MVDQQGYLFVMVWYVYLFTSLFQNTQLTIQCGMRNRKKKQHINTETYKNKQNASRMKHLPNSCRGSHARVTCSKTCALAQLCPNLSNMFYSINITPLSMIFTFHKKSILMHNRRIKILIALKLNCICNYSLQFISLHRSSEIYHTCMLKQTRNIRI